MAAQQEEARIKEGQSVRQVDRGDRALAGGGEDQRVRQADRGDRAAPELTPSQEARTKECAQFFEELVQLHRTAFMAVPVAKAAVDEACIEADKVETATKRRRETRIAADLVETAVKRRCTSSSSGGLGGSSLQSS